MAEHAKMQPRTEVQREESEMEILEKRARALARVPAGEEVEEEILHLVTFFLGDECYGVEIDLVQEVQPLQRGTWSRVPCTPDFIVGAVNIRGRIYSVMDVARFLGLPPRPLSETSHVLLVRGGGQEGEAEMELCILADDAPQVARVSLTQVHPSTDTISSRAQEYVRGVTGEMLIILDLERLLSEPRIIVHKEV